MYIYIQLTIQPIPPLSLYLFKHTNTMIQVLTTKVLLKRSIASIKKSSVNNNYTKRSLKKIFNNGFNSEERCFSTFHSWNFNRISNFPCSAKLKCLAKPPFLAGTNFSINGVLGHINYYNYNNVKYYSSSASKKEEEDEDDLNDLSQDAEEDYDDYHDPHSVEDLVKAEEKSSYEKYLPVVATWGPRILIGGGISYLTTKTFLYVSNTLLGITLSDAVYFGLFSGFVGASLLYGGAFAYYQTFQNVRPEPVFAKAIKKMANSEDITGILGNIGTFSSIQSGFVRAYKLDGGDWGLGPGTRGFAIPTFLGEDKKLVFRYPRVQMCFQVYGEKHQAMCTVEAINDRGKIKFNLIMLDILTAHDNEELQDPILVYGNEDRMYVRDQLTGFIDFKRNYLVDPKTSAETRMKH